jgi:HSP20 family protein
MAETGTKRAEEQGLRSGSQTASQASGGAALQRGQTGQMQRGGSGARSSRSIPSVFSVSPGEFFTMSPITLMRRFTEDIDRALGLGNASALPGNTRQDIDWVPPVELRQVGNNLVVDVDLPGLEEDDVRVEVTDDGLVIAGEREREVDTEDGGIRRSEIVYGRFYRLIPLPDEADVDKAQASFDNGVLEVVIPVTERQQNTRQIPISGSSQQGKSSSTTQGSASGSSSEARRAASASSSSS